MDKHSFFRGTTTALFVAVLASCGGGSASGNQAPKIQFSSQVSFGDSLSDVGSYAVGGIVFLGQSMGSGRYTINSNLTSGQPAPTNWTELIAAQLNQTAPCPAETGLEGMTLSSDVNFDIPIVMHTPECTAYGQGGSMVTYPFGPGNKNIGDIPNGNPVDGSAVLGQLTVPIVTQMENHLAAHGDAYLGDEVVFVWAGGNDALFTILYYLQTTNFDAVQAMRTAGAELVGYIDNLVLAKGAQYVVILNLPDLSITPFGAMIEAQAPGAKALIHDMVLAFNNQLQTGLTSPRVLLVNVYAAAADQIANPTAYGLTNVTDTACNLDLSVNLLGSSLVCNALNLNSGDVSHYSFADQMHPTPYGNMLIARYVAEQMAVKGWL
jgi:phospholipase/lecithinase/hemolysin